MSHSDDLPAPSFRRKPSTSFFLGNVANTVMIINTLFFLLMMLFRPQTFGIGQYARDGFCVSNFDATQPMKNQWTNSHALCFYVDTLAAGLLYYLATYCTPSSPGTLKAAKSVQEKVTQNVPGILGHGLGHCFLWLTFSPSTVDNVSFVERPLVFQMALLIGTFLFWLLFFRSVPVIPKNHATLHSIVHALSLNILVNPTFSFTYVQTVLLLTVGFYELNNPTKTPSTYNSFSLLVNLPIGFVGWVEALACDSWLVAYGGHVWYDATIPFSILCFWGWGVYSLGRGGKGGKVKSAAAAAAAAVDSPSSRTRLKEKKAL
jgi:hypothetical protein